MITRMVAERPHENIPVTVTSALPDYHLLRPNVVAIPMRLRAVAPTTGSDAQGAFPVAEDSPLANLSTRARSYLESLGISNPDSSADTAELVWMHALAVTQSQAYLLENGADIRQDFPRVPLPDSEEALLRSSQLGHVVASLLDTELSADGVTSGTVRDELRAIGPLSRAGGGELNPAAGDLAVKVGWGHAGRLGVTMPGRGRLVERGYTQAERDTMEKGAALLHISLGEALACLGDSTLDVYLSEHAYWRNVPAKVWHYTLGGYQVMKKWLSYREESVLGRALTVDEAREFMNIGRRIAALLLLLPALDANYEAARMSPFTWSQTQSLS